MSYMRFEDDASGIDVFFDDVTSTQTPDSDTFNETQVADNLSRAVPHTVKFVMDMVDGPSNDVVKLYIDGTLVHTGTSWEDYYRYDSEAVAEQSPRIVKTLIFRSSGDANPANAGKGYLFNNVNLTSGPVLVGPPTSKEQCKSEGWKAFNNPSFVNQGQCVSSVVSHR